MRPLHKRPQNVPLPVDRSVNPTICLIPRPVRPMMPNGIRIRLAVLPQRTGQTDAQTDRSSTGNFDHYRPLRYEGDGRPPDIVVGGLIFYQAFFFFLYFRHLISELAEPNSTISGHMLGSKCNLKTHVQNLGHPLSLQIRGPKTTFLDDFATQRQL